MQDNKIIELISHVEIFKTLSNTALESLLSQSQRKIVEKDEIVIRRGVVGKGLLVILSGELKVVIFGNSTNAWDTGVTLNTHQQGDIFGEYSLIDWMPIAATVIANERTEFIEMTISLFACMPSIYGRVKINILEAILAKLRKTYEVEHGLTVSNSHGQLEKESVNCGGRVDFDAIMKICYKSGDDVIVGFVGGVKSLASRDLRSLQARQYKWDNLKHRNGSKISGNWISGSKFLRTIGELSAFPLALRSSIAVPSISNYCDRVDFQSIMRICIDSGDDVIVGFAGGIKSLASRDLPSLQARLYKWDNVKHGSGSKIPGNWIRGSKFLTTIVEAWKNEVGTMHGETRKLIS